jgi:hypothetical protein
MGNAFGYISNYSQNPDGTYTCTLKNFGFKQGVLDNTIPTSLSGLPNNYNTKIDTTKIESTTINCIGILNSNKLVSLDDPNQMLLMSIDNKYIFIPYESNAPSLNTFKLLDYVAITQTIINYHTKIPKAENYNILTWYASELIDNNKFTEGDSTYDKYKSYLLSNPDIPKKYAAYLIGINPPEILLNINPNVSDWSDVAYYCLQQCNNSYKNITSLSSPSISNIGGMSNSLCFTTDSPSVIPIFKNFDCRTNPSQSPIIKPDAVSSSTANSAAAGGAAAGGIILSSSSSCCFSIIAIILLFVFTAGIGSVAGKATKRRKR